jgi:hypothetical protein
MDEQIFDLRLPANTIGMADVSALPAKTPILRIRTDCCARAAMREPSPRTIYTPCCCVLSTSPKS